MEKDFLDKFYLGFIQLNPYVYNTDIARRMLYDVNYDPFCEDHPIYSMIYGNVVLLRREGDNFYDEYSSRYRNEIKYKIGETNKYGIRLSYVKSFTDIYKEEPLVICKEEAEDDYNVQSYLYDNRQYYISHSKLDGSDAIIILDSYYGDEVVRQEYYNLLIQDKDKEIIKK